MKAGRIAVLAASALVTVGMLAGAARPQASARTAGTSSNVITIGTLYASSGQFATASMPEYNGLKFWAHEVNASGGIYVKAKHKKEKVKIIAYNDQSSDTTATALYSRLITQDHVNMFVSDFGSVLTADAVPLAQENKVVLWDQSGSGTTFFLPSNHDHYIVLTSIQGSQFWPDSLSNFIIHNKLKKVAIVYDANDFTGAQNTTLVNNLKKAHITPLYDQAIPTTTSTYSTILSSMEAKKPQMLIELGYNTNDVAFFQALSATKNNHAKVFTIFPGQQESMFISDVGKKSLAGTYTYLAPPLTTVKGVNYGMSLSAFNAAFSKFSHTPVSQISFEDIMGYNTGLIMQKDLSVAKSLSQNALRSAANTFSGKVTTVEGTFKINTQTGVQEGLPFPIGQFTLKGGKLGITDFSYTIKGEK